MFSRRTLFVVGAGASCELGLPTGLQLKAEIADFLDITFPDGYRQANGDQQIAELLRRRAQAAGTQDWNYLLHKCWQIRDALPGALSIDNVLDAHNADVDLVYIGKLAIVRAILAGEKHSKLYPSSPDDRSTIFQRAAGTWLIPFFQLLTESVRKEDVASLCDDITIITFNYDRSIEGFLPDALAIYYGLEERDSATLAGRLKIVHPYGQVGSLRQQQHDNYAPYGEDRVNLERIVEGIRTFSEGLADPDLQDAIDTAYTQAAQIVFLGFAFHPINLRMLESAEECAARKIFATTFGFSSAAKRVAEQMVLQSLNKRTPQMGGSSIPGNSGTIDELNFEPVTAVDLLNAHFRGIA